MATNNKTHIAGVRKANGADHEPLTAESLRERLRYDPETGIFTWIKSYAARIGKEAGSIKGGEQGKDGRRYRVIHLAGRLHRAHRLAWLYMTGEWPPTDVDHRDLDRTNNRWSNLRIATRSQNNANTGLQKSNTSGSKGVAFDPRYRRPWKAQVSVENKTKVLGLFSTREEAEAAYRAFIQDRFGEFARFE